MKTSLELEKRLEQLQKDINIAEVELGKSLITKKMDSSFIPLYEEFEHIESQKKSYLQDIDKIRELAANGKQINNELDIIKKQSNALLSEWPNLYEKLGIALANNQNLAYTQEYEPYRIPIEEMKSKYAEAKDALDSLRVQMENQSFMNRLLSQVQYTAKNTSFSQLQKKLSTLFIKCGKGVFETGVLSKLYETSSLSAEVAEEYALCFDLKQRCDANNANFEEKTKLLSENEKLLSDKGVVGSIDKKIYAIEQDIKLKEQEQQKLCQIVGHDFSVKYIDPDGEYIVPSEDILNSLEKNICSVLERIAILRYNVVICKRKIQIIHLSEKIVNSEHKIMSLQKTIQDNESKISQLTSLNKELNIKIETLNAEKEQLLAKRSELEIAAANDTKRIETD